MGVLRGMMESHQEQTTLLRDGLLTAQLTTTSAIERTTTSREPKRGISPTSGGCSQPPLLVQRSRWMRSNGWLIWPTSLMQLVFLRTSKSTTDRRGLNIVAWRGRVIGTTNRLGAIMDSFYERFFPRTARRKMEQQFINLRQRSRSIDEYAAEFLRLSRFAPYMVAEEEDRVTDSSRVWGWTFRSSWSQNCWGLTLRFSVLPVP